MRLYKDAKPTSAYQPIAHDSNEENSTEEKDGSEENDLENSSRSDKRIEAGGIISQEAPYGLIKEYGLDYIGIHNLT